MTVGQHAPPLGQDDAAAWLAELRPGLYRFVRAQLAVLPGADQTAEDVVQETCMAVLKALPTYQDRGHPFSTFVFAIALNKVRDAYRAASRTPATLESVPDRPDAQPGPEETLVQRSEDAEVERLLAALPDASRDVLLLRVAAGMTTEQTAEILGMSAGAVRVAQHRGLRRLRALAPAGLAR